MVSLPASFQPVHQKLEGLEHHLNSTFVLVHMPSDFDVGCFPESLTLHDGKLNHPSFALNGCQLQIMETLDTDLLKSYKILFRDGDKLKIGPAPSKLWTVVLDE